MIETTMNYQKWQVAHRPYCHFRLSVVVAISGDSFFELAVIEDRRFAIGIPITSGSHFRFLIIIGVAYGTLSLSLPWSKTFAFAARITIILCRYPAVWVNVRVKFRQFQNNLYVFDDTPNNFRWIDLRSNCCVLCPIHAQENSQNGSAQLLTDYLRTQKRANDLFWPQAQ